MSRDPGLYLQDIATACRKVQTLVMDKDLSSFSKDWRTRDAVLHNLQVIGEAVKRVPEELKTPLSVSASSAKNYFSRIDRRTHYGRRRG